MIVVNESRGFVLVITLVFVAIISIGLLMGYDELISSLRVTALFNDKIRLKEQAYRWLIYRDTFYRTCLRPMVTDLKMIMTAKFWQDPMICHDTQHNIDYFLTLTAKRKIPLQLEDVTLLPSIYSCQFIVSMRAFTPETKLYQYYQALYSGKCPRTDSVVDFLKADSAMLSWRRVDT